MALQAAHRGYEYQDLLSAARLVDLLLGEAVSVHVDKKLVDDDRFDDLTILDATGGRERVQFKHKDNDGLPLTLATFTNDSRSLALDRLVGAAVADREGPGREAPRHLFRVVLRDARPMDPVLLVMLRPAKPDSGPFLRGMSTVRLQFAPESLWRDSLENGSENPFRFLREGERAVNRSDLDWVCERLIVEVEAPAAGGDLVAPGPAEQLLLSRVVGEIGAGLYPNAHRSATDVAESIIRTARAARQGTIVVTPEELMRLTQLRHDFGAVARAHPVDRTVEVARKHTVEGTLDAVRRAMDGGRVLVLVGPPGHGKSWLCQQLIDRMNAEAWLVSEHYCFLGDADGERQERVLAESVFGSLLGRLAEAEPNVVQDQRPRFAADEQALVAALTRARNSNPDRRIALVVDGIDHVTRLRPRLGNSDPSFALAEALALLDMPSGSVLIILSQPGDHLRPLEESGALHVEVPGLDERELRRLAARLGLVPEEGQAEDPGLVVDDPEVQAIVTALGERSRRNALYATYLCKEALRCLATNVDPVAIIRNLPTFDGTLRNYYQHIEKSLGNQGAWVADVVALIDFAVTRAELKEIRPDTAHRVDDALAVLKPVLVERTAQGGVRIYHESFARFLREPFQKDQTALAALLEKIASWLQSKGLFRDPRAFRSLLQILAEADRDADVVALVGRDFVVRSVASGFPVSAIAANLATAVRCAAKCGNWPAVVRYVELSRAAATYQDERLDSTLVEFADVPMALLGAGRFAESLLHEGRTVMAARAGIQICAAVDAIGGVSPWREYMEAFRREALHNNTSYGEASDRRVAAAWLRGRLRLSAPAYRSAGVHDGAESTHLVPGPASDSFARTQSEPGVADVVDWEGVVGFIDRHGLQANEVVQAFLDTYGFPGVRTLLTRLSRPGDACIEIARAVQLGNLTDDHGCARTWAKKAAKLGTGPGTAHILLSLGVEVEDLVIGPVSEARDGLLKLTRRVQEPSVRWEDGLIHHWLDACALAARRDPIGLNVVQALIDGPGWYPCWLRFTVSLAWAEASPEPERARRSLHSLQFLTEDLQPFVGEPRACDLYPLHGVIDKTIRRAVAILDDDHWTRAVDLLRDVSRAVTTTLSGELGGPLPPDRLLRLVVEASSASRRSTAEAFFRDEIENGSKRRFYSDLAEYRLLAARLAVASGDRVQAEQLWHDACRMLTAYGWHKDVTIFELLDPLPHLIKADPVRGRARVSAVQALCERVPRHTDLRETRGAWPRWWKLLALADPAALARLSSRALLDDCNAPNWLLMGAREDLWRAWHHRADPSISGALRLTLDTPLESTDPNLLARLATASDGTGADVAARLMTLLLARVDERPCSYPYSNGGEFLERDAALVGEVNAEAENANVPGVWPIPSVPVGGDSARDGEWPKSSGGSKAGLAAPLNPEIRPAFSPGAVGLARAIRAWRLRPRRDEDSLWATECTANIFGYRLVDLACAGREGDAVEAIGLIADGLGFENTRLLIALAEGLERFGCHRLAATAYALAWTRARGHGGWLTFGGKTETESLRRAALIDRTVALEVVAQEVERVVSLGGYGTCGISQAIIYAFSDTDLADSPASGMDMAFCVWDEAFAVISDRAPRVDPSDDPDQLYSPLEPDCGDEAVGDLNVSLATATMAGLAHPGREQKRRALLAAGLLIKNRPADAAPALNVALTYLSDPATVAWLLAVVGRVGAEVAPVVDACVDRLRELAEGPFLTVRALARRLLGSRATGQPPASPADPALINACAARLWTPQGLAAEMGGPEFNGELVESVAGNRLSSAEQVLPGLRKAVQDRVSVTWEGQDFQAKLKSQFEAFADKIEKRWPDAFLAMVEAVEEAVQLAAVGGRTARMVLGEPVADPITWEDGLARTLLDDPWLPLALEGTRQPRPEIPPPPPQGDSAWRALKDSTDGWLREGPNEGAPSQCSNSLYGTLFVHGVEAVPTLTAGAFRGWRILGTVEQRVFKSVHGARSDGHVARRYRVVEVRNFGDVEAMSLPPLASGDIAVWGQPVQVRVTGEALKNSRPILGIDFLIETGRDGRMGLGLPPSILAPTPGLVVDLGLRPGAPFTLDDVGGPALSLITWRAEYETSEYHLAWPRLHGAAVLIRGDLFARLAANSTLVLRDFLIGWRESEKEPLANEDSVDA